MKLLSDCFSMDDANTQILYCVGGGELKKYITTFVVVLRQAYLLKWIIRWRSGNLVSTFLLITPDVERKS